jgi:hypothetical protein
MTATSAVGAYTAQNLVGKVGPRPVALAGMTLIGSACVLFTQVSVNGSYLDDLFVGFLLFGPGLGAITEGFQSAFVAAVGFAIIGALMALLFLRRGSTAEAAPAPAMATEDAGA